ncbi:MAG: hypothetical protein ACFCD0_08580 [Gemmataceae bacterium]
MKTFARLRFGIWKRWIWWKRTGWFQFAHSPLCGRFEQHVFSLWKWKICRSCGLLYLGVALTLGLLVLVRPNDGWALSVCYGLLVPVVGLSYPPLYRHLPRIVMDLLRFGAGVVFVFLLGLLVTAWWWLSVLTLAILFGIFWVFRIKRGLIKANECAGCPELGSQCVCSGYARQADSIRVYSEEIENELNSPGAVPLFVLPTLSQTRRRGK